MDSIDDQKSAGHGPPLRKNDRIEVIKVLVVMTVSFGLGFGLVILFFRPTPPSSSDKGDPVYDERSEEPVASVDRDVRSEEQAGYAPPPNTADGYAPAPEPSAGQRDDTVDEGEAPPEVPPGRTPENVSIDGSAFYLKCWDENGGEVAGASCDPLTVLEKRFSTRLYVVDECKKRHSGEKAEGKLSLGMEVDFEERSISFWNGASSTLEGAAKVATCLRTELSGLPISNVEHRQSRYRIFFTVLFGKSPRGGGAEPSQAKSSKPARKGQMVDVVKDRVRVRRAPVDGEVIGKISTGNQVKLLGRKAGWCNVMTPNNNEGWMICDALGL